MTQQWGSKNPNRVTIRARGVEIPQSSDLHDIQIRESRDIHPRRIYWFLHERTPVFCSCHRFNLIQSDFQLCFWERIHKWTWQLDHSQMTSPGPKTESRAERGSEPPLTNDLLWCQNVVRETCQCHKICLKKKRKSWRLASLISKRTWGRLEIHSLIGWLLKSLRHPSERYDTSLLNIIKQYVGLWDRVTCTVTVSR